MDEARRDMLQLGDSHSIVSFNPFPKAATVVTSMSLFWTNFTTSTLEKAKTEEYKPAMGKAMEKQLVLAAKEFEQWFENAMEQDLPFVLVETECEEMPGNWKVKKCCQDHELLGLVIL